MSEPTRRSTRQPGNTEAASKGLALIAQFHDGFILAPQQVEPADEDEGRWPFVVDVDVVEATTMQVLVTRRRRGFGRTLADACADAMTAARLALAGLDSSTRALIRQKKRLGAER